MNDQSKTSAEETMERVERRMLELEPMGGEWKHFEDKEEFERLQFCQSLYKENKEKDAKIEELEEVLRKIRDHKDYSSIGRIDVLRCIADDVLPPPSSDE